MLYKPDGKAGEMRRIHWLFPYIVIFLLLAGCQASGVLAPVEGALDVVAAQAPAEPAPTAAPSALPVAEPGVEVDLCLQCHADKERLIETAKPEEPAAEGESKGVG